MHPGRCAPRRDVRQEKPPPGALERQLQRPEVVRLVVAQHHVQRHRELLELRQHARLAHVAEVPDLVRVAQARGQTGRIAVVGVGDDRNAHE